MILLLALVAAAGANANAAEPNSTESRRALQSFANCTVKRKKGLVAKAIIEDWSMAMMINQRVITADCATVGMSIDIPVMKAALSESLVMREKIQLASAELAPVPALFLRDPDFTPASNGASPPPPQKQNPEKAMERHRAGVLLSKLGECVIRSDAPNARLLFDTKIGTEAESLRARELTSSLSRCLPAGSTLTLNVATIRRAVGLAYYRLAKATQGVVWQGEAR